MIENRQWTHEESPQGQPSAAAYREGCRCQACKDANAAYMRTYRAQRVAQAVNPDGTTVYLNHPGQPSKRTARRHHCIHPRCLDLAGLMLLNGAVVDAATCIVDPTWGTLPAGAVA